MIAGIHISFPVRQPIRIARLPAAPIIVEALRPEAPAIRLVSATGQIKRSDVQTIADQAAEAAVTRNRDDPLALINALIHPDL